MKYVDLNQVLKNVRPRHSAVAVICLFLLLLSLFVLFSFQFFCFMLFANSDAYIK